IRLEHMEDLDRPALIRELKAVNERMLAATADRAQAISRRGERLRERLENLTGERIAKREEHLKRMKAELEREFFDRWETRNLGMPVRDKDGNLVMDFTDMAREIADEVFNKITGRHAEVGV